MYYYLSYLLNKHHVILNLFSILWDTYTFNIELFDKVISKKKNIYICIGIKNKIFQNHTIKYSIVWPSFLFYQMIWRLKVYWSYWNCTGQKKKNVYLATGGQVLYFQTTITLHIYGSILWLVHCTFLCLFYIS